MTMPPVMWARRTASALLPLAVGPAISATRGRDSPFDVAGVSMFVATLVASGALSQEDIADAVGRLATAGCAPVDSNWLDEGKAADIFFGFDPVAARAVLTDRKSKRLHSSHYCASRMQ